MKDLESGLKLLNLEEANNTLKVRRGRATLALYHMTICRKIVSKYQRKRKRRKISERTYQMKRLSSFIQDPTAKKQRTQPMKLENTTEKEQ